MTYLRDCGFCFINQPVTGFTHGCYDHDPGMVSLFTEHPSYRWLVEQFDGPRPLRWLIAKDGGR